MHDKHALQMFLTNGWAQLLFSMMSTGALRTAEKANKKTALEKQKETTIRIDCFSQSDDFSGGEKQTVLLARNYY